MGHSEMLLAVAGLRPDEVAARVRRLATGDWSDFPPAERAALGLAYKISRDPAAVTAADRAELVRVFGAERAADLTWYACWCNYMTRVADAFQLPLERDNVFTPAPKQ